jgi:hypothetical protein
LEAKDLVKRLGVPTVLFMRDVKEIVALDRGAYPEKFGRWRGFLNRIAVGTFGIQAESYSVDWLGWVAVGLLFGYGTVWLELPNGSSKIANKMRQKRKMKFMKDKITKDDQSFGYKLLSTIKWSNTLQLH